MISANVEAYGKLWACGIMCERWYFWTSIRVVNFLGKHRENVDLWCLKTAQFLYQQSQNNVEFLEVQSGTDWLALLWIWSGTFFKIVVETISFGLMPSWTFSFKLSRYCYGDPVGEQGPVGKKRGMDTVCLSKCGGKWDPLPPKAYLKHNSCINPFK